MDGKRLSAAAEVSGGTGGRPGGVMTTSRARRRTLPLGLLLLGVLGSLLVGMSLPAAAAGAPFVALAAPARILDTRVGGTTADGQFQAGGRFSAAQTRELTVAGRVGIPASGVGAVVLNVTSVTASSSGYVTVYPCGTRPNTSSLNLRAGGTVPNAVITTLSSTGRVCLFSSGATDLLVDVSGYLLSSGVDGLASPVRLLDTRAGVVALGQTGRGPLAAGQEMPVAVANRGGFAPNVSAVVLNLTVVNARTAGYLSVYPCGSRPNSSNLNYGAGVTRANAVVTGLVNGQFCVYSSGATDVLVDASATLPTTTFSPLAHPERLLDTRAASTSDNQFSNLGAEPANATLTLPLAGRGSVPSGAKAVVLNLTAVAPTGGGYTSVYPSGPAPNASNLNYSKGEIAANLVVAPLSATGSVCIGTRAAATDLVVDVTGYLLADVPAGTAPCPSLAVSTVPDTVRDRLVYRSPLQRVVGADKVAVVVCTVPVGYPGYDDPAYTPIASTSSATVAAWANAQVAPYFTNVSGGKYVPTFVALPGVTLSTASASAAGGPDDCLAKAASVAGSTYTNVLATDNRNVDYGFASPGGIPATATSNPTVLTSGPPSTSQRGLYVGGDTVFTHPNPMITVHEMGHTIHWPHSHLSSDEYDNPTDLMSGSPGGPGTGWCSSGDAYAYACAPQSALAFDRMAAGWMTARQSIVNTGVVNYDLDAANSTVANSGGTQLVAVPDPNDRYSFLTLEGRASVGYDSLLSSTYCHVVPDPSKPAGTTMCDPAALTSGHDGVVVSLVHQTENVDGVSLNRRQSQAGGLPYSFDHVLQLHDSVVVDGVRISVLARAGNVFTVSVGGRYATPTSMKTVAAAAAAVPAPGSVVVPRSAPETAH